MGKKEFSPYPHGFVTHRAYCVNKRSGRPSTFGERSGAIQRDPDLSHVLKEDNMKKSIRILCAAFAAIMILATGVSAGVPVRGNDSMKLDSTTYLPAGSEGYCDYYNPYYPYLDSYYGMNYACTCPYCTGFNQSGYVYVNGLYYKAADYYANVQVSASSDPVKHGSGTVEHQSRIPQSIIKRGTTDINKGETIKEPTLQDAAVDCYYYNPIFISGAKYYPASKININKFFEKNTYMLNLKSGEVQLFETGYKMYSADSNVALCYNDGKNQVLVAKNPGLTYVYLYTNGGVPFLRLEVLVSGTAYNTQKGLIDVIPGNWKLDGYGSSTTLHVWADQEYNDITLAVVYGSAYIENGKVTATGNGPIVVKAYSKSKPEIQGYAVLYAGSYTSAIYNDSCTMNNQGVSCGYWNSNLWADTSYSYTICGWVIIGPSYIPVLEKTSMTTSFPKTNITNSYLRFYSDLRLLVNQCYGNYDVIYAYLKQCQQNNVKDYYDLYNLAFPEILRNLDKYGDYYFWQLTK